MAGGKKKRGHPDVEEVLARPFCYYCERDFDDLKILISHQKAKHFKCERCGRRLNTVGGLSVHMNQVHKETLTTVENALGNRSGLDYEIFGMEGIPEDVVTAHNQRIIAQFYQAEAERRAATGNPGPGASSGGAGPAKKPKFESPSELKKRLAEHKARMAEQAATGGSSGGNTPGGLNNGQSPAPGQSPGAFNGSPYAPPQVPFGGSQGANYSSFSQESYAPPTAAYQQPFPQQPGYSPPGQYPPPQAQFSPAQQYPPTQSFPPTGYQQPAFPGAPQQYGGGAPPGYNPYQPPSHTPPQHGLPSRPPSLPQPSGLPQRPSFGQPPPSYGSGPPGAQYPPQHGGWDNNGWNGPDHQNQAMSSAYPPYSQGYNPNGANASSVDDLISSASARQPDDIDEMIRMAEAGIKPPKKTEPPPARTWAPPPAEISTPPIPETAPPSTVPEPVVPEVSDKKSKKEKDKNAKMIYSDNEISPEEKMARMPRYAFVPDGMDETALVEAAQPEVAGVVDDEAE